MWNNSVYTPRHRNRYITLCRYIMEPTYILNGEIVHLCEYIKDRFYFTTIPSRKELKSTMDFHFFSIDDELVYHNYYSDFGPLNLGMLYRYCVKVNTKLKCFSSGKKKVVHYTTTNPEKRANAAFLVSCYAMINLNMVPREAYKPLLSEKGPAFRPFQDASIGFSPYQIRLMDVLDGVYRALQHGFFSFDDFDLEEYEYYESIEHGDLNWIVPNKFLAFCGPTSELNSIYRKPESYLKYFKRNNVTTVIRLNRKAYDASSFTAAGIDHHDLYFLDGGVPSNSILAQFFDISETARGAIAVHCKAGLGRTGSLIAAYLMKHYRMTAQEAIAWLRVCRPGSVIGRQQTWLEHMECWLWKSGENYRINHHGDGDKIPHHTYGIYSRQAKEDNIKIVNKYIPKLPSPARTTIPKITVEMEQPPTLPRTLRKYCDAADDMKMKVLCIKRKSRNENRKARTPTLHDVYTAPPSDQRIAYGIDYRNENCYTPAVYDANNFTSDPVLPTYTINNTNVYEGTKMNAGRNRPDQLTQGDRLNLLKGMRSRFLSNSLPRTLQGRIKSKK